MFKAASKQTVASVRAYSQAAKVQSSAASLLAKGAAVTKTGIHYTKVFGELAKYVWVKEGLSPPTTAEFQKVFTSDLKQLYQQALNAAKEPTKTVETVKNFKSDQYIYGSAVVLQLLGMFALGEIIGRRHIYGYEKHEVEH